MMTYAMIPLKTLFRIDVAGGRGLGRPDGQEGDDWHGCAGHFARGGWHQA